ncbi:hypothetical protein [Nocardia farcinica]|uniref:hypothetical protein n=1 Tax=Nocardia farcinica TaxID=37329 RepID=UPI0024561FFD|nr:hypothetical protein [Nocardia farcinica]
MEHSERRSHLSEHALPELLQNLRSAAASAIPGPAHAIVPGLLTIGGRLSFGHAMRALTPFEQTVVGQLLNQPDITVGSPTWTSHSSKPSIVLLQTSSGRICFIEPKHGGKVDGELIGAVTLPDDNLIRARAEQENQDGIERGFQTALDLQLFSLEKSGHLTETIDRILDNVEHVESVFLYLGYKTWSRQPSANRILPPEDLRSLAGTAVIDWPPEARLLIAGLSALFDAGMSVAFEEFNGEQFTASRVMTWISARRALYLGSGIASTNRLDSLQTFAAASIPSLRAQLDRTSKLRFREINGLSMNKIERVASRMDFELAHSDRRMIVKEIATELGFEDVDESQRLSECIVDSSVAGGDIDGTSLVEMFFIAVVRSLIRRTGADYGMSSGPRHIRAYHQDDPLSAVLRLTKEDFFCCCIPAPKFAQELPGEISAIVYAVSKRMQYNRWHFIAGNFRGVPATRHYYYPPRIPDFSVWSDARHGGHIHGRVRYSVRVPGPVAWRDEFKIRGVPYRGFFDIRIVRTTGNPFSAGDMATAIWHCQLIEDFWRTSLAKFQLNDKIAMPVFSSNFYRQNQWQSFV